MFNLIRRITGLIIIVISALFGYHFWVNMSSSLGIGATMFNLGLAVSGLYDAFYFAFSIMFLLVGMVVLLA